MTKKNWLQLILRRGHKRLELQSRSACHLHLQVLLSNNVQVVITPTSVLKLCADIISLVTTSSFTAQTWMPVPTKNKRNIEIMFISGHHVWCMGTFGLEPNITTSKGKFGENVNRPLKWRLQSHLLVSMATSRHARSPSRTHSVLWTIEPC